MPSILDTPAGYAILSQIPQFASIIKIYDEMKTDYKYTTSSKRQMFQDYLFSRTKRGKPIFNSGYDAGLTLYIDRKIVTKPKIAKLLSDYKYQLYDNTTTFAGKYYTTEEEYADVADLRISSMSYVDKVLVKFGFQDDVNNNWVNISLRSYKNDDEIKASPYYIHYEDLLACYNSDSNATIRNNASVDVLLNSYHVYDNNNISRISNEVIIEYKNVLVCNASITVDNYRTYNIIALTTVLQASNSLSHLLYNGIIYANDSLFLYRDDHEKRYAVVSFAPHSFVDYNYKHDEFLDVFKNVNNDNVTKNDVYLISNKGGGKTSMMDSIKNNNIYVIDSDDHGRFITFLENNNYSKDFIDQSIIEGTLSKLFFQNIDAIRDLPSNYETLAQSFMTDHKIKVSEYYPVSKHKLSLFNIYLEKNINAVLSRDRFYHMLGSRDNLSNKFGIPLSSCQFIFMVHCSYDIYSVVSSNTFVIKPAFNQRDAITKRNRDNNPRKLAVEHFLFDFYAHCSINVGTELPLVIANRVLGLL